MLRAMNAIDTIITAFRGPALSQETISSRLAQHGLSLTSLDVSESGSGKATVVDARLGKTYEVDAGIPIGV